MRPSRPQIHPQSTANPPPQSSQSNQPMQFNSNQFPAGFNPRFLSPQNPNVDNSSQFPTGFNPPFPSPQNPNFDNGGPGGPPPPQFGKHQLHPNLNQAAAAAADSNNCGPGGPLLPQFGMQQPQPNLNQVAAAADFSNYGPGGPSLPQFGMPQPQPNLNQVVAAAALQLLQQQSNPQLPVNQAQNNNLAAALVQMAGMLGGGQTMPVPGPQTGQFPPLNGNAAPSFHMPQQQQSAVPQQMTGMLGEGQTMPGPQMGQFPPLNGNAAPSFQMPQQQQSAAPQQGPQIGKFPLLNGNPAPSFQMPQQQSAGFQCPPTPHQQQPAGFQMPQQQQSAGFQMPQQQQSAGFQCPPTPHQQQQSAGFQMPQQQQSAGFQCPPTPHQQQQPAGFQMPQEQQPAGFQCPPTPHQQQPGGFQRPPTPQHQQSVRPMNGNLVRPFQAPRPMQQQQHQQHATSAMNQQLYPQTNGNQVQHHQPPPLQQQQHHLTSSMPTFNVPPSSLGSPRNSGNPMVLNGASQWNNQGPGQFTTPSSSGLGALQENPMVPKNSQPLTFPMGQWNNQGLGQFAGPSSNGPGALQEKPTVLKNSQPLAFPMGQWNNRGPSQFAAPSSNGPGALQENTIVPQNSQPLTFPMGDQPPWMNGSGLWRPQVDHASDLCQLAPNVMNKDFAGKVPGYEKGVQSNMRFQNHTSSYVKNAKGNMGPSTKNGGQGRQQRKQKEQLNYSCEEPKRKFPSITYSEREVREWREARKKNYPTTDPIIKKLRRGGKFARIRLKRKWESDEDAKLHRQQLKEVLAKQKELEVNICDIPYEYLREPKKRNDKGRASTSKVVGASEPEKKNDNGRASASKVFGASEPENKNDKGRASTSKVVGAKRPPSLLQKLLGPEKLRDKSYLLQVFRFMALNNFFDQSPDKPFKFPVVKREGTDKDDADDEDDNDDSDVEGEEEEEEDEKKEQDDEEAVEEHLSSKGSEKVDSDKTEEGEITD